MLLNFNVHKEIVLHGSMKLLLKTGSKRGIIREEGSVDWLCNNALLIADDIKHQEMNR
jgi:hypothetical protein